MGHIPGRLVLKTPQATIERRILRAFKTEIEQAIRLSLPEINKRVRELVRKAIQASPEYQSLLNGELQGELGIINPLPILETIINTLVDSVTIQSKPIRSVSTNLRGGFSLSFIVQGHDDILSLPGTSFNSSKGEHIEWLSWLLTRGDDIIIRDYNVDFNLTPKQRGISRTGKALMVKGRGWRVPPQYSGTVDNNFITRSFDGVESEITDIIESEITKRI